MVEPDEAQEKESEFAERKRLYERHRDDLSKREISNAENLDKSILTYSGAGLALSLGFLKDFIPIANAKLAWALYGSWGFFTLAMVLVIVSYVVSLKVIRLQLDRAERYYLSSVDSAFDECGRWDYCADHLNQWMSAAAFVVAIIFTTLFVSVNLKGANMPDKKITHSIAQDGLSGMPMQKVVSQGGNLQKGLTGQPMQSIQPTTSTPTTGQSQQSGKVSQSKTPS
jgi:hypothetical protein